MQEQLLYSVPQENFFSNTMSSFGKGQLCSNVNKELASESNNLQTSVTALPSLSSVFPMSISQNSPYNGSDPSCYLQNQVMNNAVTPGNMEQLYPCPPCVSGMGVTPHIQSVDWSASPTVPYGRSFSSPEDSTNRSNWNFGTESYLPQVILPPLTPRSFENTQQCISNAQMNPSFGLPIHSAINMESPIHSPESLDMCTPALTSVASYEACWPRRCSDELVSTNRGAFNTPNNENVTSSLPNLYCPLSVSLTERFGGNNRSSQVQSCRLKSAEERFPELIKYGGLDGRFSSHRKDNIDLETLKRHFHLPMLEASKKLGVCVTVLKKICRRFGISRWPHRKLRSVAKHIEKHEKAFHKGYSDHFSYEEVLELCRKNPEKFSDSSKHNGSSKTDDKTSSGSSKLTSGDYPESFTKSSKN